MDEFLDSLLNTLFAVFVVGALGFGGWMAITPPSPGQKNGPSIQIECIDFRDGERFTFSTKDILGSGIALDWPIGEWARVKDSSGRIREFFPSTAKNFKCQEIL